MKCFSCLSCLFLIFALSSCTPNRSIALDKGHPGVNASDQSTPPPAEPARKITVAELMDRVANAKPDSFLFPCTLNAYSDNDREKLRRLRQTWLSKEQDNRYRVSPSTDCVCPGICVLSVEDDQNKQRANYGILVLGENAPESYSWLAKDLDLTGTQLAWSGTTPQIIFHASDGKATKTCSIERDRVSTKYVSICVGPGGEKLAPLWAFR